MTHVLSYKDTPVDRLLTQDLLYKLQKVWEIRIKYPFHLGRIQLQARELVDSHLVCVVGMGWGDAWAPYEQRADGIKGCMNNDTAVAGSQWGLVSVKFKVQKDLVCYNKQS